MSETTLLALISIIVTIIIGSVSIWYARKQFLASRQLQVHSSSIFLPVPETNIPAMTKLDSHIGRGEYKQARAEFEKLGRLESATDTLAKRQSDLATEDKKSEIKLDDPSLPSINSDPFMKATLLLREAEIIANQDPTSQDPTSAIPLSRKIIEQMEMLEPKYSNPPMQSSILGTAHNTIGYVYRSFRKYTKAVEEYRIALSYLQYPSSRAAFAGTLKNLAYIYALQGKLTAAELVGNHALELFRQDENRIGESLTLNTLGLICVERRQYELAKVRSQEALAISEVLNNPRGIGLAKSALGYANRRLAGTRTFPKEKTIQFFLDAQKDLERSVDIFKNIVDEPIRLVEARNELGCTYRDWAQFLRTNEGTATDIQSYEVQAFDHLQRSRTLAREKKLKVEEADSLEDLAQLHIESKHYEEAEYALGQAEEVIPEDYKINATSGIPPIAEPISEFWASLGKIDILRGHLAAEQKRLDRALEFYLMASAYFQLYSESTTLLDFAMPSIYARLQGRLSLGEVSNQITQFEKTWKFGDLKLISILNDTMGIRNPN